MMAMAEAAKTSDEPWKVIQHKYADNDWQDCTHHPAWGPNTEYRIKPKEKKKLWLWHKVDLYLGIVTESRYIAEHDNFTPPAWHKTNIFIEIEWE